MEKTSIELEIEQIQQAIDADKLRLKVAEYDFKILKIRERHEIIRRNAEVCISALKLDACRNVHESASKQLNLFINALNVPEVLK